VITEKIIDCCYVVVPHFFDCESYNPENPITPLPIWIKDHETVEHYLTDCI
jgi:hypothetical protein